MSDEWYRREGLGLLTDFYELTMAAGYLEGHQAGQTVCFEYFFRSLPPHNGFAVAAGLESFLDYLEHLRFSPDDLEYLRFQDVFDDEFLAFLTKFRPSCTVRAVPEGTLVFPYEPTVQVVGNVIEAQLIESALLNFINHQTLIATKAARICLATEGEPVLEFGLRRAQGPDGALSGARAAYIGGCAATSNVLAGKVYGIPVSGTHAHSWVMSFSNELEAFRTFARLYPDKAILLVDTYDTLESGVPNAIRVFGEMRQEGKGVRAAIRLDSGDLAKLSKAAYDMLVAAGFDDPLIVASNDLDEDLIADLKRQGARINAWGVGTHLITSRNCPALSGVYKLVAVLEDGRWIPRIKTTANPEKATDPDRKQVVRYFNQAGHPLGDVLFSHDESPPGQGDVTGHQRIRHDVRRTIRDAVRSEPLLEIVFENGRRTAPSPPLEEIRRRALDQIATLPEEYPAYATPRSTRSCCPNT